MTLPCERVNPFPHLVSLINNNEADVTLNATLQIPHLFSSVCLLL